MTEKNGFERFFYMSSDMLAITDEYGTFVRTNPSIQNTLGWNKKELEERSVWEILIHEERIPIQNTFKNLAKGHPVLFAENNVIHKNGTIIPIRWTAYPDTKNHLFYITARSTDESLMENDYSFRLALNASPTAILVVHDNGEISYTTPLVQDIFGYTEEELLGEKIEKLLPEDLRKKHLHHRKDFLKSPYLRPMGMKSLNLWGKHKNGQVIPIDVGLNPVHTLTDTVVITSVIDISEREKDRLSLQNTIKRLQDDIHELDQLASIDDLTQLFNRRVLMKSTEIQVYLAHKNAQPLSFLMLDIDDFKSYNDEFGHPEGDLVLKKLGEIIRETTRKRDIPARYGGEEFAIVMPNTNKAESQKMAERIRKRVANENWTKRAITISLGMMTKALYHRKPGINAVSELIIQADEALYAAKNNGKNRSIHFSDLQNKSNA